LDELLSYPLSVFDSKDMGERVQEACKYYFLAFKADLKNLRSIIYN